jgi:hypothetical protein
MSRPEEFTIHIEADGRIILDGRGMEETSYRRILELLRETIGPARPLALDRSDPPGRHLARLREKRGRSGRRLGRQG